MGGRGEGAGGAGRKRAGSQGRRPRRPLLSGATCTWAVRAAAGELTRGRRGAQGRDALARALYSRLDRKSVV